MSLDATQIIKKEMSLEGIPFSIYLKDDNKPKPLLFFFHGFGGNRITGIMGRGEIIAEKGFYVIAIDAYLHGEREPSFYIPRTSMEKQKDIVNVVMRTAKDAKYLYDKYFKTWKEILPSKVYAYGVSMGGATTFYLASIMQELKTFVSLVGSPSFCEFYKYKKTKFNWEDEDYYQINLKSYLEEDPLINYPRLQDKNIFMGNGEKDTIVPLIYAKELAEKLNSPKAVFKVYDTAHSSTPSMLEESYQFLEEN